MLVSRFLLTALKSRRLPKPTLLRLSPPPRRPRKHLPTRIESVLFAEFFAVFVLGRAWRNGRGAAGRYLRLCVCSFFASSVWGRARLIDRLDKSQTQVHQALLKQVRFVLGQISFGFGLDHFELI